MKPVYSPCRRELVVGSLAAAAVGTLPSRSNAYQGCYVGVAGPLTGPQAPFGQQLKDGAALAIRHLNERGMKVELSVADDDCRPDRAVAVAQRFQADKIVCVFGHFCSVASLAASRFYERQQIVQIIPTPVSFLSDGPPEKYIFRMLPRGEFEARIVGKVLAGRFKDKRVAIVSSDTPSAKRYADVVKQSMAENGLKVSVEESYSLGTSDFSQLSEKLRSNRIDAFYVAGPSSEAARVVRQSRQVGLAAQLISGNILGAAEFDRISGGAADGALMISSIDPRMLPEARTVVETFKRNGFEPEGYTLYAYAAVQSWAQAVQKAGTDEPAQVADALHNIGSMDTIAGKIAFDERGDVRNPRMGVYQFREGGFRLVEEIRN